MDFDDNSDFYSMLNSVGEVIQIGWSRKIKIEHEISRIDKSLGDVKSLLDLCKTKGWDGERGNKIKMMWHLNI